MSVKPSHTLREKHLLSVLENRLLRMIFGSKGNKVSEEWKSLHKEEICDMFSALNIILVRKYRTLRCRECATHAGENRRIQDFGGRA